MSDYEVTRIDQSEDPHFALYADCDPVTYEDEVHIQNRGKSLTMKLQP